MLLLLHVNKKLFLKHKFAWKHIILSEKYFKTTALITRYKKYFRIDNGEKRKMNIEYSRRQFWPIFMVLTIESSSKFRLHFSQSWTKEWRQQWKSKGADCISSTMPMSWVAFMLWSRTERKKLVNQNNLRETRKLVSTR